MTVLLTGLEHSRAFDFEQMDAFLDGLTKLDFLALEGIHGRLPPRLLPSHGTYLTR